MREVTVTYEVYKYNELSDDAKKEVKQWYLDGQDSALFSMSCMDRINELFPNSSLKIQYSLSYCQGDGFNIYGTLRLDDVLKHVMDKFTEDEIKYITPEVQSREYIMPYNNHYCYCICNHNDFAEDIEDELENEGCKDIRYNLLKKFSNSIGEYLSRLCREFEENGYEYFYKIEEDELEEWCEDNGYEFYKSGKLFCKG